MTSVEADVEGVFDTQDERDVPLSKGRHPGRADELPIGDQSGDGGLAKDGAEAEQKGAALSRGGVPGAVENVPHHRNGDAIANDREHQDIDVVPAELPKRAVEGQKPQPRSKTCDPNDHSGELACVYDDLREEALETAVVRGDLGLCGKHTGEMTQIDGAGQQDTNDQNAEALQAALAQREVTLEAQPQGGSDVPSHQYSDPVIRRIGNSTPPSGSYRKTSCTVRLIYRRTWPGAP